MAKYIKAVRNYMIKKLNRNEPKNREKEISVGAHLKELRYTIIGCLTVVVSGSAVCYGFFRAQLMELFTNPLDGLNVPIIYTSVTESFTTEMKVGIIAGIIATSPIIVFLIWRFVGPALFPKEKRQLMLCIPIAVLLFGGGVCFCYFIIFPFALRFFLSTASVDLEAMLTIGDYVNFLCKILVPFGLIFETPLIVYFLVGFRIIPLERLKKARKYILLVCFIIGAIITPPDVVSQLSVAGPMYLMYEIGMLVGVIAEKYKARDSAKAIV
ncbi:MAG: twin-arginine translocase subunit TatC [Clostridiales Family XIII bacterium]|nr:twin-arginine translocase subunit TatC [Clostridiales Family XIII bacterium]